MFDNKQSLADIRPRHIPKPTFASYLASSPNSSAQPLVHIRITHSAINHVDLLYAHGVHQNNKSGLFKPPFTLGLEFSGIVLDTYTNNDEHCNYKIGDRVWGGTVGSHAEEIIVPASTIHHLPSPNWSLHDIAALGAATIPVSYGALNFIGRLKAGETILIHAAAGGLGIYAVQIAKAIGAKVIGTVGSEQKRSVIEDLIRDPKTGAVPKGEGVVNYSNDEWQKEVLSICKQNGKDGVDVVFDTVGLVQKSIKCTVFNGRIIVVGFAARTGTGADKVQELEKIDVNRILLKQIKLLGYRFGETSRRLPQETAKIWQGLNEMLAKPQVIKPVVYKTYKGLDAVPEAMQALSERKVFGKAVIEICSETEALKQIRETQITPNDRSKSKL